MCSDGVYWILDSCNCILLVYLGFNALKHVWNSESVVNQRQVENNTYNGWKKHVYQAVILINVYRSFKRGVSIWIRHRNLDSFDRLRMSPLKWDFIINQLVCQWDWLNSSLKYWNWMSRICVVELKLERSVETLNRKLC